MTRIADEHDAIATVKTVRCYLWLKASLRQQVAKLYQKSKLPGIREIGIVLAILRKAMIFRGDLLLLRYCFAPKQKVTVGNSSQNVKEIRHALRDRETALHKAYAEYNNIKRKATNFSYSFSRGRPELIPEMTFKFSGLKSPIDDIVWLGTRVTHKLDGSGGFTTDVVLEVMMPDADDISQLVDNEREITRELLLIMVQRVHRRK